MVRTEFLFLLKKPATSNKYKTGSSLKGRVAQFEAEATSMRVWDPRYWQNRGFLCRAKQRAPRTCHEPPTARKGNHCGLVYSLHLPRAQLCKKKVILNPYIIVQISVPKTCIASSWPWRTGLDWIRAYQHYVLK